MDGLGFVEAVDRLGQRVVVGIADRADRGFDPGLGQALGVFDRHVLAAPIAVVDQAAAMHRSSGMQRLFERVQHEGSMGRPTHPPADDPTGKRIDHECHIDEAGPCRDVCKVRHPQHIRPRHVELPVDVVERTGRRLVADRGLERLATDSAGQALPPHQPFHRAPSDLDPLPVQLPPNLAGAVDLEVRPEDTGDLRLEACISQRPRSPTARVGPLGLAGVVGGRGDRQHPADRLDPVVSPVIVDERDHVFDRRSSSAAAK